MNVIETDIPDVKIIEPKVFGDERGFFFESYNTAAFNAAIGREVQFVQDNHSMSTKGVLRGLHYQIQHSQAKLVRVVAGDVFDVAIDLRKSSPTFGKWVSAILSVENKRQMWIPEGFAHGFFVVSEKAEFLYKTTNFYAPEHERCIAWDDETLNIEWPIPVGEAPIVSDKDAKGFSFNEAELFP